jgi:putative nucleotidyltransferase with HDIG domain
MAPLNLEKMLSKIHDLPTLSAVASRIIQITQNPKSSALEVGTAISQDQALASRVLKMSNSTFYGFPRKITTITHAVVILGFANIRNLVLTASVFDMFSSKGGDKYFDQEEFWKHSFACGTTSKLIAKNLGIKDLEEVFIWGLFHDIGKLVLDTYFHDDFKEVISLVKEEEILIKDAEKKLLGFDHAAVGGEVANKWNLPPLLIKAIRFHHNPTRANESMRMVAIVHLADVLCRAIGLGNGGDNKIPCINERPWKVLNFNQQIVKRLFSEMEQEIAHYQTLLASLK